MKSRSDLLEQTSITRIANASESAAEELAVRAHIRSFSFGHRGIIKDISLAVEAGETLAVLGPSGCGKSTLIRLLAGLLPRAPDDRFDGNVELFKSTPFEYRRTGNLAVMFQNSTLLPHLTVEKNIEFPLKALRRGHSTDVEELLKLVGLEEFKEYLPRDLSGGMQTRVALARGFVSRPELMLMDEPFTGLDLGWKESLYQSLQELRNRYGTSVVMVTHDLAEAVYNSGRILVLGAKGAIRDEIRVPGTFPRGFKFGETVAVHTATLSRLAEVLTKPDTTELA